ncbi:P-loop containing nucleoside triphosphate hydrolase protein [Pavlovales sp. CCMP2436]|nr:P-loop containing nucleoside triphosphate hydrolase protein [Pavlovales sp. CCMP2436]
MPEAMGVISVKELYFSYEVAQNINTFNNKKIEMDEPAALEADTRKTTRDGGLSVDMPRRQHEAREEIVYKVQLRNINLELPRGARCLLIGSNGSGKSTLLNILGGKHMVGNGDVRVLTRKAFEDTTLTNEVALLTGNWTRTVAFVGHGVPYQAMAVQTLIDSHMVGVDPKRLDELVAMLGVKRSWNLTAASDGQRRRVQILLKLLRPFKMLLLDEITTDLDLLVRQDLLAWLKRECDENDVTVVYCTHIFDGLDGWATHVAHIEQTRLRMSGRVEDVPELSGARGPSPDAEKEQAAAGVLFSAVQGWLLDSRPDFAKLLADGRANILTKAKPPPDEPAVEVRGLRWGYAAPAERGARTPPPAFDNIDITIKRGERVLLTGANGAGKSTLLRLMGGKHMVSSGSVHVLGRNSFEDVQSLNLRTGLLTGDWSRTVACVGSGVPYQADFAAGFMANNALIALKAEGHYDHAMLDARLARLRDALDLDPEWRMNAVSDGQRRRIQILLKLLRPADVYFMDEVTTDLDLLARQSLLQFLHEESETRGVTVVYATHILDGLDGWPTKMLHLSRGQVVHYGAVDELCVADDSAAPRARESGSLYRTVRTRLRSELVAEAKADKEATKAADAAPTPMEVEAPKPVASMPGGSRFDRFGGSSGRQANMYG